jgi:hypothetical protein
MEPPPPTKVPWFELAGPRLQFQPAAPRALISTDAVPELWFQPTTSCLQFQPVMHEVWFQTSGAPNLISTGVELVGAAEILDLQIERRQAHQIAYCNMVCLWYIALVVTVCRMFHLQIHWVYWCLQLQCFWHIICNKNNKSFTTTSLVLVLTGPWYQLFKLMFAVLHLAISIIARCEITMLVIFNCNCFGMPVDMLITMLDSFGFDLITTLLVCGITIVCNCKFTCHVDCIAIVAYSLTCQIHWQGWIMLQSSTFVIENIK